MLYPTTTMTRHATRRSPRRTALAATMILATLLTLAFVPGAAWAQPDTVAAGTDSPADVYEITPVPTVSEIGMAVTLLTFLVLLAVATVLHQRRARADG